MMKLTGLNLLSNLIYDPYITNACAQMDLRHPNTHLLKLKTKVRDKLIYPSTSSTSKTKVRDKLIYPSTSSTSNWHFMIHWLRSASPARKNHTSFILHTECNYFPQNGVCGCGLVFTTRADLLAHTLLVQSRTCEECDRVFVHSRARDQHFDACHQFWCNYGCDRVFRTPAALDQHNSDKHGYYY